MANTSNEVGFNVRLKKDLWQFLKKNAFDREMSLSNLIREQLEKYKNKCEKKY